MECPNCENGMKLNEDQSRGMGNQSFQDCPVCGMVALVSGDRITQSWPPTNGYEGGNQCHSDRTLTSLNVY